MTDFTQWTNTRRLYHADHEDLAGGDLPTISKPEWVVTHTGADGNPAASVAVVETSPDGHSARISTGPSPGKISVTVSAAASPTAVASTTFTVNVKAHQPVSARSPTFRISQHRNGPIH